MSEMFDPYEDYQGDYDGYYGDEDYENSDPVDATTQELYFELERIRGVLYLRVDQVTGVKLLSQDWGEADFWTETFIGQPTQFGLDIARRAWALGRDLKNGESRQYSAADFYPDDEEESEE